ncbi:MAG: phosphoadenylyl-sulfate reductase [Prolixibacteraceae bacterium]|jgi:phosphoadenosine phosphosulfate reductase|nr:phosphoadenylyl-sulfate reductase [Prolixibacteraceae bacterium]
MSKLPQVEGKSIVESIAQLCEMYPGNVVFTTSFGFEDQVVTDIICSNNLPVEIVTLDTGRLFEETYKVFNRTIEKYKINIKTYHPSGQAVGKLLEEKGPFSFYKSVENRKGCCFIRKVEPLKKALSGKIVWITGLRSEQSENRQTLAPIEWDNGFEIFKYNPLHDWTLDKVKQHIKDNHVPYNVLHDRGFVSIGCAPCTRAINPGDDFRAGRWWWEDNSKKECGLHTQGK